MLIQQDKIERKDVNGVIIENNVKAKITNIELTDIVEGILTITLNIIDERYKGRILKDKVSYQRNHNLAWKYLNIRESAGVPYSIDESDWIDIDDLLLNKEVTMNLSSFDGISRKGNAFLGQRINYVTNPKHLSIANDINNYSIEDDIDSVFVDDFVEKDKHNQNETPFNKIRKV